MNPATKILLSVAAITGLGAGALLVLRSDQAPALPPSGAPLRVEQPPEQPVEFHQAEVADRVEYTAPQPVLQRTVDTTAGNGDPNAEQGVTGRVLLPSGMPLADCPVFLLDSSMADPLQLYLAHKLQQKIEPAARVRTDAAGVFRLGVEAAERKYDLRVASDEHPELQHKSILVRRYEWVQTGDLQLETGGIVQGRVLLEEGSFPLPNATVYLTNPHIAYKMLPTPGRERGIVAITDGGGYFRYTNAPREGLITLAAEAEGYAYTELTNQPVKPGVVNEFILRLASGVPIGGVVVDTGGAPIARATINVTAQSDKLLQTATAGSDEDGTFLLPMMRPGAYQLSVTARGYEDKVVEGVVAGDRSLKVVLTERGCVRLRVLAANGAPVKVYQLALRRFFPNNPGSVSKVPDFRDLRITPADYREEHANIRNVPAGQYVFQIEAANHAKTLSPPFTIASIKDSPVVEVTLTMGGAITGSVVDDRGAPVAGAVVATDMNGGLAADSGLLQVFQGFLPDKHTVRSTRTGPDGSFRLTQLAFADYMLRVSHPDFCQGSEMNLTLDTEGQTLDVGRVQLLRGALLEGVCTLAGRPAGQVTVAIGPPEGYRPETDGEGRPRMMFSAKALTDANGRYVFQQRVPPGSYRINAWKEAGPDDIFGRIFQMRQTQRQLFIRAGQDRDVQNFDLPVQ